MSNKLKTTVACATLVGLSPRDFDCPEGYQVLPKGGWKERTYYIVEVAFSDINPIHRKIFFSGFLQHGEPTSYASGFGTFGNTDRRLYIDDAYFIKVIREIDINSINVEAVNP